jgi:hypothetical protein
MQAEKENKLSGKRENEPFTGLKQDFERNPLDNRIIEAT